MSELIVPTPLAATKPKAPKLTPVQQAVGLLEISDTLLDMYRGTIAFSKQTTEVKKLSLALKQATNIFLLTYAEAPTPKEPEPSADTAITQETNANG
jgi:hypothetical protein